MTKKKVEKLKGILTNMRLKFEFNQTKHEKLITLDTKQTIGSMEMQVMFENVINMGFKMFISDNVLTIYIV